MKIPWRRAWQPTPVFFSGESHGQRILEGYSQKSQSWLKRLSTHSVWFNFTHGICKFPFEWPSGRVPGWACLSAPSFPSWQPEISLSLSPQLIGSGQRKTHFLAQEGDGWTQVESTFCFRATKVMGSWYLPWGLRILCLRNTTFSWRVAGSTDQWLNDGFLHLKGLYWDLSPRISSSSLSFPIC